MTVVRRVLWWSIRLPLFPILFAIRGAGRRIAPQRLLKSMHEQADLLFYEGQFEELAKHCRGVLVFFPDDPKLHSMYAIALADTEPEKSAEMAKRAIELSSGSL